MNILKYSLDFLATEELEELHAQVEAEIRERDERYGNIEEEDWFDKALKEVKE